jgi:hypothetical protein
VGFYETVNQTDPMKINTRIRNLASEIARRGAIRRTLACCVLALAAIVGSTVQAVPITLSFDNANQSVAAPSNGSTIVTISGTIVIDPAYHIVGTAYFSPTNFAHTLSLTINTTIAFNLWDAAGVGTYTGAIFEITVAAGTPPDFYGYEINANNLATLGIGVQPIVGGASAGASQAYSVTVTNGNGNTVPENGRTVLLLGVSVAGMVFARRAKLS